MKITEVLIIYIMAHLLGDYYLQNKNLAAAKTSQAGAFIIHAVLYAIPFGLSWFIMRPFWPALVSIVVGHAVVDLLKILVTRRVEKSKSGRVHKKVLLSKPTLFVIDQLLHIVIILLAVFVWPTFALQAWVKSNILGVMRWALVLLAIWTPASVSFEEIFRKFKPQKFIQKTIVQKSGNIDIIKNSNLVETVEGAGSWIGILERTIAVLSISQGQFSALGFVMAAKSLARFKLLSEDQSFAEYYLIGTLFSVLFALLAYLLVFKLLV
jgi:hypothetical protein